LLGWGGQSVTSDFGGAKSGRSHKMQPPNQLKRKPIFFVIKHADDDWTVEAEWPDGTIETVKTFEAELKALDWLSWQSHAWLENRGINFTGAK
jgi:hypothetical protein